MVAVYVRDRSEIMKVLVVGGAGYIGSHTALALTRKGHEVVVFDNLSTGNKEAIPSAATFVQGDLLNSADINGVLATQQFDIVMHFAAKLVVPESVEQPIAYFENNVHGVALLLEGMRTHGVKRIIFSSTAAVYGEPKDGSFITEDTPTNPINPYGASKRAAEDLIRATEEAYGIKHVIFRYFNVAGADAAGNIGLSPKTAPTHLVPVINETLLGKRQETKVFGTDYASPDGTCIRDYIHVSDLADAHVLGAEHLLQEPTSATINLGSHSGFSVMEIIKAAEEEIGQQLNYVVAPRRAGDPSVLVAANIKAKELLGWAPTRTVQEMIRSDYEWRAHPKY
jgi:UDP-glucose 4-epimerase